MYLSMTRTRNIVLVWRLHMFHFGCNQDVPSTILSSNGHFWCFFSPAARAVPEEMGQPLPTPMGLSLSPLGPPWDPHIVRGIPQSSSSFPDTCSVRGIHKMQVEEVADPDTCSGEGPVHRPSTRPLEPSRSPAQLCCLLAVSLSLCLPPPPALCSPSSHHQAQGPNFSDLTGGWKWWRMFIIMTLRLEKSNCVHICSLKL